MRSFWSFIKEIFGPTFYTLEGLWFALGIYAYFRDELDLKFSLLIFIPPFPYWVWIILILGTLCVVSLKGSYSVYLKLNHQISEIQNPKLTINSLQVRKSVDETATGRAYFQKVSLEILNPPGQADTVDDILAVIEEGTIYEKDLAGTSLLSDAYLVPQPIHLHPGQKTLLDLFSFYETTEKKDFAINYRKDWKNLAWTQLEPKGSYSLKIRLSARHTPDQDWDITFGFTESQLWAKAEKLRPILDTPMPALELSSPFSLQGN